MLAEHERQQAPGGVWVVGVNLVPGDTNRETDVFVADVRTGPIRCIAFPDPADDAAFNRGHPVLSADGRLVAFSSSADDIVRDDEDSHGDVFVHFLASHTTVRASLGNAPG